MFNADLQASTESHTLICSGSLFQRLGAALAKVRVSILKLIRCATCKR